MSSSAFQSFSVPSSPATKLPITPQRVPRSQQHRVPHTHAQTQSFYRSPLTPSTPYTPLSLRSSDSSSTLTTPDSVGGISKKHLAFLAGSPNVVQGKDHSLADIAENWRSRANENGIKVSSARRLDADESTYGDDEASVLMSDANDSGFINEDVLLPAAFLSTHRRTASDALPQRSRVAPHSQSFTAPSLLPQPLSPMATRTNTNIKPQATSSPVRQRRTLSTLNQSMNVNLMSTPPPNRALSSQLKMKGSLTDPAQPRRREAFGVIRTPASQNIRAHMNGNRSMSALSTFNDKINNTRANKSLNPDTSLDLFDIDENDFENDNEYGSYKSDDDDNEWDQYVQQQDSFSVNLPTPNANQNAFTVSLSPNGGYPAYPQPHIPHAQFPQLADPFVGMGGGFNMGPALGMGIGAPAMGMNGLNSISESVEQHFHQQHQLQQQQEFNANNRGFYPYGSRLPQLQQQSGYPKQTYVPIPQTVYSATPVAAPIPTKTTPIHTFTSSAPTSSLPSPAKSAPSPVNKNDCSVCLAQCPPTLAVLQPCEHPLCSACLTSALNIVGEKDMRCAVCKGAVVDFKLISNKGGAGSPGKENDAGAREGSENEGAIASREDAISLSNPPSPISELESPFEFGLDFEAGLEGRASTPKLEQSISYSHSVSEENGDGKRTKMTENIVLRIDNVPWDITPQLIRAWLQLPVARVHVLLDPKGKTMSHAYVEVADSVTAGAILRGEGLGMNKAGKPKMRGSVLGKGRRARGVTVTRSGQEELMKDLFPSWRGRFAGSCPSLSGLSGDQIVATLESCLMTEGELAGLLYLIREPDSHFLKVPSLPFHSLISLLCKFPADVDSRVFWSAGIRDMLFDISYAAVQVLLTRVEQATNSANPNHEEEYTMELVQDLLQSAINCQAFTAQQIKRLADLAETCSVPVTVPERVMAPIASGSSTMSTSSSSQSQPSLPRTLVAENHDVYVASHTPFSDLAREFGVEAQLVQALAQRLASAGLC
ncbi:hypothetical protein BDQ12DRAFT_629803 [Crucibulum laeve]|uniref:RING-type domain-containing protein n=1 Tax=Crucibulum laeve TaxID=68775 RepID=A0A5C3M4G7_9AGAR|nr:hypothetical protein BDQ12DRAFT_629803 [Crucibulum laeve]